MPAIPHIVGSALCSAGTKERLRAVPIAALLSVSDRIDQPAQPLRLVFPAQAPREQGDIAAQQIALCDGARIWPVQARPAPIAAGNIRPLAADYRLDFRQFGAHDRQAGGDELKEAIWQRIAIVFGIGLIKYKPEIGGADRRHDLVRRHSVAEMKPCADQLARQLSRNCLIATAEKGQVKILGQTFQSGRRNLNGEARLIIADDDAEPIGLGKPKV